MNQPILTEAAGRGEVYIDIGPEPSLVHDSAEFFPKLLHGLHGKKRHGTAIRHRAVRPDEGEDMGLVDSGAEHADQDGIVYGKDLS